MAEAVLSPLLEAAVGSLVYMIQDEVDLVWGIKQELEKLASTLSAVKSVVKDAEEKQVKDNSVRDWLKRLKEVAYEVDDILDDYATETLRWELAEHTTDSCNMQVSNFLPCICFKKVFFRRSIGHKIRGINDRLRKIAEERHRYHLRDGISEKKIENRETDSFVDEKKVLGRESEKKEIVDLLLSSDDRDDLFVIPIVGFGGLGKTTLAKLVYNDEEIKKHFQPRMWVCVSEEFEIKRLIKLMIESATREDCKLQSLDLLQNGLRNQLSGKRFLLVLDDVWNEDQAKWERLKDLLRAGENGSRIIVTTRSEKVSEIMGTTSSFHLKGLSDDECWSLIKKQAFEERIEEVVQPHLVKIGMQIAKKCKGVPLAAKTLGSLLRFKREESEWLQIRDSETWTNLLNENEDNILNSLRISYDHLPSHLKQCFTYCSLYPKDYAMEKKEIINLWMAQGFIQQPSKESGREMEDIGSDYIDDLLWRSFFQDEERELDGDITYKMHDLMHDLAQFIAKDECLSCIQIGKAEEVIALNKPYHLSLVNDLERQTIPDILYKCSYLRTLFVFESVDVMVEVRGELFLKLRCLRVLDLGYCNIKKLPDSIGNLKHLRYLNLSFNPNIESLPETIFNLWNLQTLDLRWCGISKLPDSIGNLKQHLRYLNLSFNEDIQSLPETICNLRNLQMLDIRTCSQLHKLPKHIENMVSLRHLEMGKSSSIKYMPSGIGRLTCLQTLRVYKVGKEESEFGGLGELQHLINLRGALTIAELENAKNIEEAKKANLRGKQHLHTLELYWTYGREKENAQEEEGVLEALQPHTDLRRLKIYNYGGSKFPSWMGNSSLTNMVSISLYNFSSISCETLPSFGKLRHLKELYIEKVYGVKYFSATDGSNYDKGNTLGFPSLEKLRVCKMPDLEYWSPSGQGSLGCLRELNIMYCPKLRAFLELPSLEKLEIHEMLDLENWSKSGELNSLRELDISNCPKLKAFPELPLLEKLEIYEMPNLKDWSESGELNSLRELDISNCPKLKAFPETPSLEKLEISEMPNLEGWSTSGEGNLSCLRELTIRNCPNLKLRALPKPSLEELNLYC